MNRSRRVMEGLLRRGARLLAFASFLLIACVAHAQGSPLFVQGSEVNLRKAPNAEAEIVAKLPIATACDGKGAPAKMWQQVKCGEVEGFVMASLLDPVKPDFEKTLAKAQDEKLPAKDRLEAALRASTLDPSDITARRLLEETYFVREFELFPEQRKKAVRLEDRARCTLEDGGVRDGKSYIASNCVGEHLGRWLGGYRWTRGKLFPGYRWDKQLEGQRGLHFVVVVRREDSMYIFKGQLVEACSTGSDNYIDFAYHIYTEVRQRLQVPSILEEALVHREGDSHENPQWPPRVLDDGTLALLKTFGGPDALNEIGIDAGKQQRRCEGETMSVHVDAVGMAKLCTPDHRCGYYSEQYNNPCYVASLKKSGVKYTFGCSGTALDQPSYEDKGSPDFGKPVKTWEEVIEWPIDDRGTAQWHGRLFVPFELAKHLVRGVDGVECPAKTALKESP